MPLEQQPTGEMVTVTIDAHDAETLISAVQRDPERVHYGHHQHGRDRIIRALRAADMSNLGPCRVCGETRR